MGGLFGVVSKNDCVMDVFFGTDYHSHLGTKRGGMCMWGPNGFDRAIHNIENSPFRTKFEKEVDVMAGTMGIGSISDGEPQPLTVFSNQGEYSIGTVGRINNKEEIVEMLLKNGHGQFMTMSGNAINNTELVAALISTGSTLVEGIRYAQDKIDGSLTLLILTPSGIYAARDKFGRTPLIVGEDEHGYCVASESFSFVNLGYQYKCELGAGEILLITKEGLEQVGKPQEEMRVCTFLWTYYGYTPSVYEGENVENTRYRNGRLMAEKLGDLPDVDYVAGVPDSGVAHALGFANASGIPYARPLIKYTPTWPRSFMPQNQKAREQIAKMKLVPVFEIINGKKFILIDDSIVRGTQLSGTVRYLHDNGANEIHVRSACPPIMFGCKYLNFSRSVSEMDLISRRVICDLEGVKSDGITNEMLSDYSETGTDRYKAMTQKIKERLRFNTLEFQELEGTLESVGVSPCKLCTYCWDGKE